MAPQIPNYELKRVLGEGGMAVVYLAEHRLLHIHKNVPGILAKINNIFAKHHINIIGQYLKTNENIGYVIMDISKGYTDEFVQEIKDIDETIRFRMLY